jgi:hypothetical protein
MSDEKETDFIPSKPRSIAFGDHDKVTEKTGENGRDKVIEGDKPTDLYAPLPDAGRDIAKLPAAERAKLYRQALAKAEEETRKEEEEKQALAQKRLSELRDDGSPEALHERLRWAEAKTDYLTMRLAMYDRWLHVLSEKTFGPDHGHEKTFGEHYDNWVADQMDPVAANNRDREHGLRKLGR